MRVPEMTLMYLRVHSDFMRYDLMKSEFTSIDGSIHQLLRLYFELRRVGNNGCHAAIPPSQKTMLFQNVWNLPEDFHAEVNSPPCSYPRPFQKETMFHLYYP